MAGAQLGAALRHIQRLQLSPHSLAVVSIYG
jgi:hypothetical protein